MCELGRYLLVEPDERTYLVVDVHILRAVGSLDTAIERQFHLLARLARLLGNKVGHGTVARLGRQQRFEVGHIVFHSYLQYLVGSLYETFGLRHEVGFAGKTEHVCLGAVHHARHYDTLRCIPVGTFAGHEFTLFADNLHGTLHIAVRFCKRILAVHHAGHRHLAQFRYVCKLYLSHNNSFL